MACLQKEQNIHTIFSQSNLSTKRHLGRRRSDVELNTSDHIFPYNLHAKCSPHLKVPITLPPLHYLHLFFLHFPLLSARELQSSLC